MADSAAAGESCLPKANGTGGESDGPQADLEAYDVQPTLTKWDWLLPGLGDSAPECESNRVPSANAICPNGDSIRYEPLRCRRVECPNCYRDEQVERTFRTALEIEAYARVNGERPHAVQCSVPPSEAENWTYERLNTSLCRRSYRRMREQCGVIGGYVVVHPWRVQDARKDALARRGFGSGGDRGGYWQGVREDVLELGDPRKYAEFGPHVHNIGFPEFIDPHEGSDFVVKKYAELDGLQDVVGHVRYLLSHRGVRDGEEVGRSVRPWGAFHHCSDDWNGAESELPEDEYNALASEVAEMVGKEWDASEGELASAEPPACPECGTPVSEFRDLWELPDLVNGLPGAEAWVYRLEKRRRAFFLGLFEKWRSTIDDGAGIELGDLEDWDAVTVWSVRDRDDGGLDVAPEPAGADGDRPDRADGDSDSASQHQRVRAILAAAEASGPIDRDSLAGLLDASADVVDRDVAGLLEKGELIDSPDGLIRP